MKQYLIDRLIQTLFRFKQIETSFRAFSLTSTRGISSQNTASVSIAEVIVLRGIKDHIFDSGEITIPDLLCISRAAVSQLLGGMEENGYILREINKANRRKHSLSLTEKGRAAVEEHEHKFMELLTEIVTRFGEKDMKQLIRLSCRFIDTIEEIKTGI
ncbi:MAG: MarR family transcriptional regulator [Treponema sp.]|jgi:DNA-binding MarR family transcriptional regulator|nr:MarR family transcriptional regulator [Treponema sp.]